MFKGNDIAFVIGIENIASYFVGKEVWEEICPESSFCLNKSGMLEVIVTSYKCNARFVNPNNTNVH